MTPSEEILSRYKRMEYESDVLGRRLGVRRLKQSELVKIQGMTPDLNGSEPVVDEKTGKSVDVPRRSMMIIAAAVCKIDDDDLTFPKTRGELDAVLDRLDQEGLGAASKAYSRFFTDGGEDAQDQVEAAKNS